MIRIAWRSLLTGFESSGSFLKDFTHQDALEYVKSLNDKYKGQITHWVSDFDQIENEAAL
jgi:hypothetical protein